MKRTKCHLLSNCTFYCIYSVENVCMKMFTIITMQNGIWRKLRHFFHCKISIMSYHTPEGCKTFSKVSNFKLFQKLITLHTLLKVNCRISWKVQNPSTIFEDYSSPRSVIVWNSDSKLGMNNVSHHKEAFDSNFT